MQPITLVEMNGAGSNLDLLWVPPGSFTMGSPATELQRSSTREDEFNVRLQSGFWMSRTLTTLAQWDWVLGTRGVANGPSADLPVENVNWFDACAFAARLSEMHGSSLPDGYGVALPTEAQWEYCCKGGTSTRYYCGDEDRCLDDIAWHAGNSDGHAHPVAVKLPNKFGFFDMLGNVWEWVWGGLSDYPAAPATDWNPVPSGDYRILRGGSYNEHPSDGTLRCSYRGYMDPSERNAICGFRVTISRVVGESDRARS